MSHQLFGDPSMDGTVWGESLVLRRGPDVRFFYCEPRYPKTPSHVWWDGIAFFVDQAIFHRQADMSFNSHDYVQISFGPLRLIADGSRDLTLEQLEAWQAKAQEEAGGSTAARPDDRPKLEPAIAISIAEQTHQADIRARSIQLARERGHLRS